MCQLFILFWTGKIFKIKTRSESINPGLRQQNTNHFFAWGLSINDALHGLRDEK